MKRRFSSIIPRATLGSHDETSLIALLRSHIDFGQYTYSSNPESEFVFVNHGFYRTED